MNSRNMQLKHDERKPRYLVLIEKREIKLVLLCDYLQSTKLFLEEDKSYGAFPQFLLMKSDQLSISGFTWIAKDFHLHAYSINLNKLIKEKFRDVQNLITRTRRWKRREIWGKLLS